MEAQQEKSDRELEDCVLSRVTSPLALHDFIFCLSKL